MTTVLVTGGTGNVGSAVVEHLRGEPVTVRLSSRAPDDARKRLDVEAEFVEFDLGRPETWGHTLESVDRLFLLIPPGTGAGPVTEFVDAAVRTGVERIVYLSIIGAEKVPFLPHRRVERHVQSADVSYTFLRAAYFMQNLSGIHRPEIVERDEIFVPAGDGALGFVDARDVGAVAARELAKAGHDDRAYDLTGPAALDFTDVAAIFSDVLARRIVYRDPSIPTFVGRMRDRGIPNGLIALMVAEYTIARFGFASRTTTDVEEVLDRPPRTVREFVEDCREQFEPV